MSKQRPISVRTYLAAAAAAFAGLAALPASADIANNQNPVWGPDIYGGFASDQVIVRIIPGAGPVQGGNVGGAGGAPGFGHPGVDAVLARWGATAVQPWYSLPFGNPEMAAKVGLDRYYIILVPHGTDTPTLARELAAQREVFELAQFVGIGGTADTIPNDPSFGLLYGMQNTGQNVPGSGVGVPGADINAPKAWDIHTGTGSATIAVIDSGVNINHVDLAASIVSGWNTVQNNTNVIDDCPHGTHVAGTAAAIGNNGIGVVGVSWAAKIMPVKVLTGCNGTSANCAAGIVWAADNGAHIATMSLQYYDGNPVQAAACEYAWNLGVTVIAATGNSQPKGTVAYPAKFPFCMGIGATNNKDQIAGFSNAGPEIDVSAPGQDVYSSVASGGYGYLSGTSMATPHVAGLAALLKSYIPCLTPDMVEQIIRDTTDDKGPPGWDPDFGTGRINAFEALKAATATGVFLSILSTTPTLVPAGTPVDVEVRLDVCNDTLVAGSEKLHYRFAPGAFTTLPLVAKGGGMYAGAVPAAACGDNPEFYVSAEGVTGGVNTAPFGAPGKLLAYGVGEIKSELQAITSFEGGLPAGWTATGLWHITSSCSPGPICDGSQFAYYGISSKCNYDNGAANSGSLSRQITLPSVPLGGKLELSYCSNREDEGGSPYDKAEVRVNGAMVGTPPQSNVWKTEKADLTAYAGQSVKLEFFYDTVDYLYNTTRGWQIDNLKFDVSNVVCESGCYPDCDQNNSLNIDDFLCFQLKFALQDPFADCDENGIFNIDDFLCFQLAFALGCK